MGGACHFQNQINGHRCQHKLETKGEYHQLAKSSSRNWSHNVEQECAQTLNDHLKDNYQTKGTVSTSQDLETIHTNRMRYWTLAQCTQVCVFPVNLDDLL
jgi:hypothetical protein